MKPILMFYFAACPFCKKALAWEEEILREHPEYRDIPVERVDERVQPDVAERFDYYYVPTYSVGGEKVHEGSATKGAVEAVFRAAFQG